MSVMVQPTNQEPLPYDRFRAGTSFQEIRDELTLEQRQRKEQGLYMFVTRRTVLGRMTQRKQEAYAPYQRWMRGSYG